MLDGMPRYIQIGMNPFQLLPEAVWPKLDTEALRMPEMQFFLDRRWGLTGNWNAK